MVLINVDVILFEQKSGIELLIPDMVIDDYLFEPCGYSMNGISKFGVSIIMFLRFILFQLIQEHIR